MGLLDLFRKPPPIRGFTELEDFLDSRAAFLVQKCVFEYSRARAGVLWQKLFKEAGFKRAVEESRWRNYPLGLENVTVMAEHSLRPYVSEDERLALRQGLIAAAANVTDRYPVPAGFESCFWAEARERLAARIDRAGLAPPKPIKDIPKETMQEFVAAMPIHASLRGHDYVLLQNNVRFNLCRMYEDLTSRADLPVLAAAVVEGPHPVVVPAVGRRSE
jgi:hypothetical protein